MRFAVACTLALLLAPSFVSSTEAQPRDALAVSVYGVPDVGVIVAWTPAPNAVGYAIFRGASPDDAEYVGQSTTVLFHDPAPLEGASWYVIYSIEPRESGALGALAALGKFRGSCVHQSGTTGVTVTASHCMPADPI